MQRPARAAAAVSGRQQLTGRPGTHVPLLLLAAVLGGVPSSAAIASPGRIATVHHSVDYVASGEPIANPERGFYRDQNRCDRDPFQPAILRWYRDTDNATLVMCDFYLTRADGTTPNLTDDIRPEQLDFFDAQAQRVRDAGAKMIVRFAYTDAEHADGPYDAAPEVVQRHLDQLAPKLDQNRDVIAVVQAGFVGWWGEGWYSDHFGDQGDVNASDWANRKAIVDKLLASLPDRMVQVRTITQKGQMYGYAPVQPARTGSAARVGHHNDCFLRNEHDSGTYGNPDPHSPGVPSPQSDREFLEQDSRYVAVGGETCGVAAGTPEDPQDRTDCAKAVPEMAEYHYSFLNLDYSTVVIDKWRSQGCKLQVDKKLGYRFSLKCSSFPDSVNVAARLPVHIRIENTGWATPFNPRPVFLVLRNTVSGERTELRLDTDPRQWYKTALIDENVELPSTVSAGTYELLLYLPDEASLRSTHEQDPIRNPDYAIRMATEGVWEPATGFNKLLTTLRVR
jgi:hypothetical protein